MRTTLIAVCLLFAACARKSGNIPVRIADVGPGLQMQYLPISFAKTLGYYKDEGLDVTMEVLPSSAKAMQALLGGSIDAASMGYWLTIQVDAEGQHVRSFFVAARRAPIVLVVAQAATNRIRRIEDLKGAVIGIPTPGSPPHFWVNYYLAAHGLRSSDVTDVSIGVGPSAIAAVESGRVAAATLSGGDHFLLLRRNPSTRILVDATAPNVMREAFGGDLYVGGTIAAKQEWLDRNPDIARRLARALSRTHRWIATHTPEEIRQRLPESSRSQDAAVDRQIILWGRATYTADGKMPAGAPEAMKHFLDVTEDKVRNTKVDLAATWTNEFLPVSK